MSLTYRSTVGRRLTVAEGDGNISHLASQMAVSVRNYGATGDGATNDAAAIQNAINAVSSTGGIVYFPQGVYNLGSTTITLNNKTTYRGAGKDTSRLKGTILSYGGSGDAIQINNPVDSSTPANITIEDLWVHCSTRTAGKAAIADVGSTYLSIHRVGVSGNDYGIILDQSELTDIDECDFELTAVSSTAGVWLVNGDEHTSSASAQFTNRISINRSQFNGTTGVGIMDDGGYVHAFRDNNYNGLTHHIRTCGNVGLSISGGEFESAASSCILISNLTAGAVSKGSPQNVEIGNGAVIVPTAGQPCISSVSCADLTLVNVYLGNTAAAKISGIASVNRCVALNLFNAGGGDTFNNQQATNHWEVGLATSTSFLALAKTELRMIGTFRPATDAGAQQTSTAFFGGGGVPNNANGTNGDFYFRSDGFSSTSTCVYHKEGGSWLPIR